METNESQPQYKLNSYKCSCLSAHGGPGVFFIGWEWLAVSSQNQQRAEKTEGALVCTVSL